MQSEMNDNSSTAKNNTINCNMVHDVGKWCDTCNFLYISTQHPNEIINLINKRGSTQTVPLPVVKY